MRYLKGLAVAVMAASAVSSASAVTQEDHDFCMMTSDLAYNSVIVGRLGASTLEKTLAEVEQVFQLLPAIFTERQRGAVRRAIKFGFSATPSASPVEIARFQYVGCIATEI